MNFADLLNRFQFNYDFIFNNNIRPISDVQVNPIISQRHWDFSFNTKISFLKFKRKKCLIS